MTTFANIASRVAQYLDRTDLNTSPNYSINNWINDTRVDLALKYNFRYLYAEATASTTAGTYRYALPSDYLGHLVVWAGSKKLMRISQREFDELTQTSISDDYAVRELTIEETVTTDSLQAAPDYYIERGMEIDLYPTPDAVYTLTLRYYAKPSTTGDYAYDSASSAEDYIMRFHADAVIWGTCLRGAIYLDDEQKKANFAAQYKIAVEEMVKREKQNQLEDQHPRVKNWEDYDLSSFKRMVRLHL